MRLIGQAFAIVGVACLAVAITAGLVAGACFEKAKKEENENGRHGHNP